MLLDAEESRIRGVLPLDLGDGLLGEPFLERHRTTGLRELHRSGDPDAAELDTLTGDRLTIETPGIDEA